MPVVLPVSKHRLVRPFTTEYLVVAAGLLLVIAYRWIMDDAFVYFRYIDNFLFLDIGLVYNAGEYVEGFSSPLWLLLLLPLRAMHANYVYLVNAVGVIAFIAFAYLLVVLNRRLSPEGPRVNLAIAYLCACYGVNCYFTSGLESPLVLLAAPAYALYVLNPASRFGQIAIGFLPLLRPEFIPPVGLAMLWGWWATRRVPLYLVASTALTCLPYLLFRIYYYADLFPNTYYLKNETMPRQGLLYLHETMTTYWAYAYFAVMVVAVLLLWLRKDTLFLGPRAVMLLAAAVVTVYVVKIGGDARHFRYLAFPFTLAICATAGLVERVILVRLPSRANPILASVSLLVFLLLHLRYPPQLSAHPLYAKPDVTLVNGISDAHSHRTIPSLQFEDWGSRATIPAMLAYRNEHQPFVYQEVMAFDWCAANYKHFDSRRINSLGLTDAILAHTQMPSDRPAHKLGLRRLAKDLERIQRAAPSIRPGMNRAAVESGSAPPWMAKNLVAIETIECKIYNTHDWRENLGIALTPVVRIHP